MGTMTGHVLLLAWGCWALSLLQGSLASPFCDLGPTAPLAIFDPVMFCVFLSTSPPKKMIFRIQLEEYASLVLAGSKNLALGGLAGGAPVVGGLPQAGAQALSCIATGMYYLPLNMVGQNQTQVSSAAECQARCASVRGCAHFSFFRVQTYGSLIGDCHLQNSAAKLEASAGAQSGPPTCEEGLTHDVHAWVATSSKSPAFPLDCSSDDDGKDRGGAVSCPQVFASASHIANLVSLVVNVREGVIHSFFWDNGCEACGPTRCVSSALSLDPGTMLPGETKEKDGACGRTHVQCGQPGVACDLNVLVTWAGTDKNGRHLQSAGRRLSRFGGQTVASVYETVDHYQGENAPSV